MQDYIILCDESGNHLGTAPKLDSHNDHTPLHLAFSIFIFRKNGDVLLQQRSHLKKTWPLMWSNTCCGHQKLDEDLKTTALKRLEFEIGITQADITLMLPKFRYTCEKDGIVENEICPVFVGTTEQEPTANPDEVEACAWMPWSEWMEIVNRDDQDYSYWSKKETKELLETPAFQDFLKQFKES